MRSRAAQGRDADVYALTRQNPAPVDDIALNSARIEDVHLAWKILGHQHRRIYELIVHRGLTNPRDICAAARVSISTGYTSLAALATAGLIDRGRATVAPGSTSLDTIAAAHHLEDHRAERIARHRQQRATWHTWLAIRDAEHGLSTIDAADVRAAGQPNTVAAARQAQYLASVLATGPPPATKKPTNWSCSARC